MDIKVEIMPSCEKKLGANWDNILGEIIGEVALQAETECKKEAPVKTGSLMRGHSTKRNGSLEASVHNNMKYWVNVVYGTSPHVIVPSGAKALYWKGAKHPVTVVHHPGNKPNNYPQRALNKVIGGGYVQKIEQQVLSKNGLI